MIFCDSTVETILRRAVCYLRFVVLSAGSADVVGQSMSAGDRASASVIWKKGAASLPCTVGCALLVGERDTSGEHELILRPKLILSQLQPWELDESHCPPHPRPGTFRTAAPPHVRCLCQQMSWLHWLGTITMPLKMICKIKSKG